MSENTSITKLRAVAAPTKYTRDVRTLVDVRDLRFLLEAYDTAYYWQVKAGYKANA